MISMEKIIEVLDFLIDRTNNGVFVWKKTWLDCSGVAGFRTTVGNVSVAVGSSERVEDKKSVVFFNCAFSVDYHEIYHRYSSNLNNLDEKIIELYTVAEMSARFDSDKNKEEAFEKFRKIYLIETLSGLE